MIPAWKTYWSIFWRTFTVLAAAVFAAAQTWDWASNGAAVTNAGNVGWLLLGAAVGALAAAGWAFVNTPAVTPLQKAIRAAVEALLMSSFATVTITNASDVVALRDLVVPSLAAIALAFLLTYFNNQGGVPQPTDMTIDPSVVVPFKKPA
jgi:hypothetical protein